MAEFKFVYDVGQYQVLIFQRDLETTIPSEVIQQAARYANAHYAGMYEHFRITGLTGSVPIDKWDMDEAGWALVAVVGLAESGGRMPDDMAAWNQRRRENFVAVTERMEALNIQGSMINDNQDDWSEENNVHYALGDVLDRAYGVGLYV